MYDPNLRRAGTKFGDLYTMEFVRIRKRSKLKLRMMDEIDKEAKSATQQESSVSTEDDLSCQAEELKTTGANKYLSLDLDDETIEKHLNASVEELKQELRKMNEDKDLKPTRPYIICLDSDNFKFTRGDCYLTIENLSPEPVEYEIKIYERHEFDILDKQTQVKNKIHNYIFSHVNPSQVSHKERNRLNLSYQSQYTYGEVEFRYFYPILQICRPQKGEVFWDIGCGACKPMIIAALCFPQFKAVKGVEYVSFITCVILANLLGFRWTVCTN